MDALELPRDLKGILGSKPGIANDFLIKPMCPCSNASRSRDGPMGADRHFGVPHSDNK
jgi:hypothetical protein